MYPGRDDMTISSLVTLTDNSKVESILQCAISFLKVIQSCGFGYYLLVTQVSCIINRFIAQV